MKYALFAFKDLSHCMVLLTRQTVSSFFGILLNVRLDGFNKAFYSHRQKFIVTIVFLSRMLLLCLRNNFKKPSVFSIYKIGFSY